MELNKPKDILIEPYGGRLIDLLVAPDEREDLLAYARTLPRLQLTARNICDLELLAVGGFSPVDRFLGQSDYERVIEEMRLADGRLFPLPITLTVSRGMGFRLDEQVALADHLDRKSTRLNSSHVKSSY